MLAEETARAVGGSEEGADHGPRSLHFRVNPPAHVFVNSNCEQIFLSGFHSKGNQKWHNGRPLVEIVDGNLAA